MVILEGNFLSSPGKRRTRQKLSGVRQDYSDSSCNRSQIKRAGVAIPGLFCLNIQVQCQIVVSKEAICQRFSGPFLLNLYPTPRTVWKYAGFAGSDSKYFLKRTIKLSRVLVSTSLEYPHTLSRSSLLLTAVPSFWKRRVSIRTSRS